MHDDRKKLKDETVTGLHTQLIILQSNSSLHGYIFCFIAANLQFNFPIHILFFFCSKQLNSLWNSN